MSSQLLLSFTPTRTGLHLIGDFDIAQRHALRRQVSAALARCGRDLDVDASKVTFVDCGTLWELERAQHELVRRGGRLTVRAASPIFRRVALLADYPELVPDAGGAAGATGTGRADAPRIPWRLRGRVRW